MFILEAENIQKIFNADSPVQVLKGINLQVMPGESVAIIGKSGEGKSTLLHILGTLENPTSGTVKIAGKNLSSYDQNFLRNQKMGFIFQFYNLLEEYSAIENVLLPAKIARKDTSKKSFLYQRALVLLEEVGLSSKKDVSAKKLSGGEKQRLAIARAFCNDPDILFADEPSGNLDHHNALQVQEKLLFFAKKQRKTLILVTHDHAFANLCDRVFLLKDGKLE